GAKRRRPRKIGPATCAGNNLVTRSAGNADGPFHRRRLRRYGGVMTQSTPALFCECAFVSAKRPRWRAGFSARVTGTPVAPDSNGFHLFLVGGIACIIEPGLVVTCVRPRC